MRGALDKRAVPRNGPFRSSASTRTRLVSRLAENVSRRTLGLANANRASKGFVANVRLVAVDGTDFALNNGIFVGPTESYPGKETENFETVADAAFAIVGVGVPHPVPTTRVDSLTGGSYDQRTMRRKMAKHGRMS